MEVSKAYLDFEMNDKLKKFKLRNVKLKGSESRKSVRKQKSNSNKVSQRKKKR